MFATCLKTSPSRCSRLLLFLYACVFTKRKRTRAMETAGTKGETPDLLIARHSCPFVRHLIASRGSRGILRGGYLFVPFSPFLDPSSSFIQLHAARLGVRYTFRGHRCPSIRVPCRISLLHVSNAADQSCLSTLSFFPGFRDSDEHSSQNVLRAWRRFTIEIALKIASMMPIYSSC